MSEKDNLVKAINKNVRSGARKANLVLNFIKGLIFAVKKAVIIPKVAA